MYSIKTYLFRLFERLSTIDVRKRRLILIILDLSITIFSFQASFLLSNNFTSSKSHNNLLFYILIITLVNYFLTGQYKPLTRYIGSIEVYRLALRNFLNISIFYIFTFLLNLQIYSINFFLIYLILSISTISLSRFALRDILLKTTKLIRNNQKNVVIYGACKNGAKLAISMRNDPIYNVSFFIDQSKELINRDIAGLKIYPVEFLNKEKTNISQIIIAIPNLKTKELKKILNNLYKYHLPIMLLNQNYGLTSDLGLYKNLRSIEINDLLGRENVAPDLSLMNKCINNKTILITGGGGSIGGELSRQIVKLNPEKIIIIDFSEINLYSIDQDLAELKKLEELKIETISILGNACDMDLLNEIFSKHKIDIVFHAAAYKHVPIVESNPLTGIANNIVSTDNICKISIKFNIEKVVLISSDKAVRPANIMGKSKRISELIIQSYSEKYKIKNSNNKKTLFSMVRFGNVLASSGSVVPLFKKQISEGGPITITHPEIIRYFMTIEEASQLLIQACYLAKGGDVFLLDMGEPVKIYDLAQQMIKLSGFTIQSKNKPMGDIKIEFTGLRSGEKLYEELLIDSESKPTEHPLIYTAEESFIPYNDLMLKLQNLYNLIKNRDIESVNKILDELTD